jgi:hypothetical protein
MQIAGSGSITQRHGSADPDPHQNVMDPQQCPQYFVKRFFKNRSWIFIALPRFYVRQEGVKIAGPYYLTLSVGALKHRQVPVGKILPDLRMKHYIPWSSVPAACRCSRGARDSSWTHDPPRHTENRMCRALATRPSQGALQMDLLTRGFLR